MLDLFMQIQLSNILTSVTIKPGLCNEMQNFIVFSLLGLKAASGDWAQTLGKQEMSYSSNSVTACSQSWHQWSDLGEASQTTMSPV